MPDAAEAADALAAGPAPAGGPLIEAVAPARLEVVGDGSAVDTVVFFDIDGTLLRTTKNKVHADSFAYAFEKAYGFSATMYDVDHHGMTDRWIIELICANHGLSPEATAAKMPKAMEAMLEYCRQRRDQVEVEALPGVLELLTDLAGRRNVVLGLVTGNLEEIGLHKVSKAGLSGFFSCGGFGSDHASRAELIRIGLSRSAALFPKLPEASQLRVFHVGDTLRDVAAAREAGVRGIGVATGGCSYEVLGASPDEPYAVVRDMAGLPAMLALLGLHGAAQ